MAALIGARDWGDTAIGPADAWPQSLKTIVGVITASPLAMIVLWGPALVQIYNAAYAHILAARHPAALGQPTRDCWPEVWDFNAPIYEAVRAGEVRAFPQQLLTIERHGAMEAAWFDLTYSPVRDEAGAVGGVLVTVIETTEQVKLAALAEAEAEQNRRLRALLHQSPGVVALLKGPDHELEFANLAYLQLMGRRHVTGQLLRDIIPSNASREVLEVLDEVFASGVTHTAAATPMGQTRKTADGRERSFVDVVYSPTRGADGAVSGVFMEGREVTERVRADAQRALMIKEMNHRVKNTLATVQAMAMLAGKTSASVPAFVAGFTARIVAMAKTHDMLTDAVWQPIALVEVLKLELAPYMGGAGQVSLDCEDLAIDSAAAVNLSLIVHELLTNATKYGALADPGGRLSVSCERAAGASSPGAVLTWTETTARPVGPMGAAGFGSVLIARLAKGLGGGAVLDLRPEGLRAVVRFAIQR